MKRLILLLGMVFAGSILSARQIPHYKMDSFAFFSDAVILCEETNLRFVETEYPGNTKTTHAVVSIKILEVFKGDLKQGTEMEIEFAPVYGRYRAGQNGYKDMSRNPPVIVPHKYLPIGKTVLFLKRSKNNI